ncbi:hypothetical protein ACFL2R_02035 [Patescibacteria group bacterium]
MAQMMDIQLVDISLFHSIIFNGFFVDFYANNQYNKVNNVINNGFQTFAISPLSGASKFSPNYANCTGLTFSGISKKTRKPISFLTHQCPSEFIHEPGKMSFEDGLNRRINELYKSVFENSIRYAIFGGNYELTRPKYKEEYLASMDLLAAIVKRWIGFSPRIATGPNMTEFMQFVQLHTRTQKLVIIRDTYNLNEGLNDSYLSSETKRWELTWDSFAD